MKRKWVRRFAHDGYRGAGVGVGWCNEGPGREILGSLRRRPGPSAKKTTVSLPPPVVAVRKTGTG